MPDFPVRVVGVIASSPGPVDDWLGQLMKECAARSPEMRPVVRPKRGEALSNRYPHPAVTPRVILWTANPDLETAARLARGEIPGIFVHEAPDDVVRRLMRDGGGGFQAALAQASDCLSVDYASDLARNALHLGRDVTESVRTVVEEVLRHFGCVLQADAIDAIVAAVASDGDATGQRPFHETITLREAAVPAKAAAAESATTAVATLSDRQAQIVREALPMQTVGADKEPAAMIWPPEVLVHADDPTTPVPRWISVLGPARTLVSGPGFALRPGVYEIEFAVEPSESLLPQQCAFEVHAGVRLARTIFDLTEPVGQSARFSFVHDQPGQPVQIMFKTERGAIDGALRFLGVSVRLIEEIPFDELVRVAEAARAVTQRAAV